MKIFFCNMGWEKIAIKRLLQGALNYLGQDSKRLEMTLSVVTPDEIKELNKTYRGVDSVTDVLSFPTIDNLSRGVLNVDDFGLDINPETGKLNIGDVVICRERAIEQANEYGHSVKREMCFLALHGMLHLLGYDHIEPADEEQMTRLQSEILSKYNIHR